MNVASLVNAEGEVIKTDDCILVDQFRTTNQTVKGSPNNYWVFGYFHTDANLYYCTKYVQRYSMG